MNHLELKDISKSYGPLRAVDDVNLTAQRGDVVALLGDNGAGKSTLLKMIAGAETIDAGEMVVDGESVSLRWRTDRGGAPDEIVPRTSRSSRGKRSC